MLETSEVGARAHQIAWPSPSGSCWRTVTIEPASEQEIADTSIVMGGEDWELWMNALSEAKLLAPGATSVAYSYIGPVHTWPIYKDGTIGRAKVQVMAERLDGKGMTLNEALLASFNPPSTTTSTTIPMMTLTLPDIAMSSSAQRRGRPTAASRPTTAR